MAFFPCLTELYQVREGKGGAEELRKCRQAPGYGVGEIDDLKGGIGTEYCKDPSNAEQACADQRDEGGGERSAKTAHYAAARFHPSKQEIEEEHIKHAQACRVKGKCGKREYTDTDLINS